MNLKIKVKPDFSASHSGVYVEIGVCTNCANYFFTEIFENYYLEGGFSDYKKPCNICGAISYLRYFMNYRSRYNGLSR